MARKKRFGNYKHFNPKVSKLEMRVSHVLTKAGIIHTVQHQVGRYYFDIKIGKVLLQVNGDYWHCNPKKYKANEIVKFPGNRRKMVCNVWKRDLKKKLQANRHGYRVIYLWEQDISKSTDEKIVKDVLNQMLNKE